MGKQNKIELLYRVSDPEMYEAAQTCHDSFVEDKADFITFDADFNDPFAAGWQTLIDDAEALPSDETLDDEIQQFSAAAEQEMQNCRVKFQDSKFFIEKTFPNNQPRWFEFGYDNYETARKSQKQMIPFMENFHRVAEKYKVDLIAKGYSQVMIDEIDTLRTALKNANRTQESAMKALPGKTQDRHIANNKVWEKFALVCTAGKRIYKTNYGKYQRYLLPPGDENSDVINIKGIITDTTQPTGISLDDVLVEVLTTGISIHSISNGHFEIGGLPDGNYILVFSKTGYNQESINVTVTNGHAPDVTMHLQAI